MCRSPDTYTHVSRKKQKHVAPMLRCLVCTSGNRFESNHRYSFYSRCRGLSMSGHVTVPEEPKHSFLSLSQRTFTVGTAKIYRLFQISSIVENFCFPFCFCLFRKNEDANVIRFFVKTRVVNNFYFFLILLFCPRPIQRTCFRFGDAKLIKLHS